MHIGNANLAARLERSRCKDKTAQIIAVKRKYKLKYYLLKITVKRFSLSESEL